jgi:hypothetical protein
MLKQFAVTEDQFRAEQPGPDEDDVKRVFMVLHGYYGGLFLSKFSTGMVDAQGRDQGVANARRVWSHGLRSFDAKTVAHALEVCKDRHPEFPPTLPQFVALCNAVRPREVYRAVGYDMPAEKRSAYAARARAEMAALAARRTGAEQVGRPAVGLDALKQAIADAVRTAGGDEVAALVRLDRMFPMGAKA